MKKTFTFIKDNVEYVNVRNDVQSIYEKDDIQSEKQLNTLLELIGHDLPVVSKHKTYYEVDASEFETEKNPEFKTMCISTRHLVSRTK
jgi:hypothetical protein